MNWMISPMQNNGNLSIKMKEDYETLMSYDFESQSEENKLNTKFWLSTYKD